MSGRPPRPAVAGLLLAAGEGRRMGGPKALVALHGELLVERGVRLLAEGGCDPVVVVLGAAGDEVRQRAALEPAEVMVNPAWADGMGTSLRAGLASLAARAQAVVVLLVDQPLIGPAAIGRLVAGWQASGRPAAVATYRGEPGHPVLLDASVWQEVAASARGDRGARAWLRANPERVMHIACDDTGRPDDLDTPDDLSDLTAIQEGPCS